MSTTYPPRLFRYMLSSQKERDVARASSMKPGFYGQFPPIFSLFYSRPGNDFLSLYFYLVAAPTENAEPGAFGKPIYAVTFHKGPGTRQVTIHSTTQHGSTPISVTTNDRLFSSSVTIKTAGAEGEFSQTGRLKYNGFMRDTHSFSLNGETFEIRAGATMKPKRRQIVWLNGASSLSADTSVGNSVDSPDVIVATWTEGTVPNKDGKLATFYFANSDITERLGEQWALTAIASVLAVCQQGVAIEGARFWYEEKQLEKNYRPIPNME